jgi:hypothetical protein
MKMNCEYVETEERKSVTSFILLWYYLLFIYFVSSFKDSLNWYIMLQLKIKLHKNFRDLLDLIFSELIQTFEF